MKCDSGDVQYRPITNSPLFFDFEVYPISPESPTKLPNFFRLFDFGRLVERLHDASSHSIIFGEYLITIFIFFN